MEITRHSPDVVHQFCDSCDFETLSHDEIASIIYADTHTTAEPIHTVYVCAKGKQY